MDATQTSTLAAILLTTFLVLLLYYPVVVYSKPPNIVIIIADDYGYNDIGYHGSEIATPTLDNLAREGVKLENYYVQPICSPTRSQLMTGRYQIHTGLQHSIIWPSQPYGVPLEYPTLADLLRQQGYSTHAIGKWHLGLYKKEYTPLHRGFDTFYGYWEGGEDYYSYWNCDDKHGRGIDDDYVPSGYFSGTWCGYDLRDMEEPVTDQNGTYSTFLYTDKAIEVINGTVGSEKPFFLYLAYQAVHAPMEVPDNYMEPYEYIEDETRRIYAGMVSALDEGVKNVTDVLRDTGLMDNTILIFSTDNGGQTDDGGNNWPLRGRKHTLWEGGVRGIGFVNSPLIKQEVKGTISREMMHVSDWFPTIAEAVGATVNASLALDGHSQWSMIRDGAKSPREEILHNIDIWQPLKGDMLYNDTFDTRVRAAIRVGDYKLLTGDPGDDAWHPVPSSTDDISQVTNDDTKNVWLFDVVNDPTEHNDLSDTLPEVVQDLLSRIAQYNATAQPPVYPDSDPNCDPQLNGGYWGPWL